MRARGHGAEHHVDGPEHEEHTRRAHALDPVEHDQHCGQRICKDLGQRRDKVEENAVSSRRGVDDGEAQLDDGNHRQNAGQGQLEHVEPRVGHAALLAVEQEDGLHAAEEP